MVSKCTYDLFLPFSKRFARLKTQTYCSISWSSAAFVEIHHYRRSSGVLESNAMMIFLDELHGFLGMCTCMRSRRRFSFPPILILSAFSFL
jgi:hypothetical protein